LPNGWRAVADLDQLTSLTFRLAWSETYVQAVNSEVINNGFLTNNFKGFSLNLAGLSYENFLSAATATTVQTSITLRQAPQVQFSSVDQAPFHNLPVYFSFDSFVGAAYRQESITPFSTPNFVERNELAPSVTVPLHFGSWLDVTPSFTFRSMRYGGQLQNGNYLGVGFFSNAEEFSLVLRPASIERVWGKTSSRWKHVIEPKIEYNYVTGIQDFARIIRFDEYDTLTNTNEIGFGVTQRLYHRSDSGESQELVTWRLYEKYFFDPTFGGALIPGQRNVFETLEALTPFAFADQPRHFSPIVSDLLVEPGKRFDAEFIVNYDPQRGHTTAIGTLLKIKPYKQSFLTVAHLSTINLPILSPTSPTCDVTPFPSICDARANQVRGLLGYGDLTGRGFNATVGASYDISQSDFQNQIIELGYNGSCCGAAFEYRKFAFGQIRNENQYLFVFRIANIGSAGNLRRPEKIF
jgi:LPS-assembly protein